MLIVSTIVLTILVFPMPFALNHITNVAQDTRLMRLLLVFAIGVIIVLTLGLRNFDEDLSFNLRLFQCYRGLANQISYKWRTYGLKYDAEQFRIISTGICNIVANLALLVPIGCLLPMAMPNQNFNWWKILLIGFGFSLIVETTQLVTHRGCFDLDDLFHNSIGAVLGYALGKHVYFIATLIMGNQKWNWLKQSYTDLKKNYDGVFDSKDLDEAFNHDEPLKNAEDQYKSIRNKISAVWIALILVLVIFTGIFKWLIMIESLR